MGDFIKPKTRYPLSKGGRKCIGPCFGAGRFIIHPQSLDYVSSRVPFCPVADYEYTDPKTGKIELRRIDECYFPTEEQDTSQREIEMNILVPTIDFNCDQFLKIYYNIYSFENALKWIDDNNQTPINTRLRIINCAWQIYGLKIDIIDDLLINFYIEVIKKDWIKNIYSKIKNFIQIDKEGNNIYVREAEDETEKDSKKYRVEKTNFFIKNFVTRNNIYKFLSNYIEDNRDKWDEIYDHNERLKKYLTRFFVKLLVNETKRNV